jgi:hypothetical protein
MLMFLFCVELLRRSTTSIPRPFGAAALRLTVRSLPTIPIDMPPPHLRCRLRRRLASSCKRANSRIASVSTRARPPTPCSSSSTGAEVTAATASARLRGDPPPPPLSAPPIPTTLRHRPPTALPNKARRRRKDTTRFKSSCAITPDLLHVTTLLNEQFGGHRVVHIELFMAKPSRLKSCATFQTELLPFLPYCYNSVT